MQLKNFFQEWRRDYEAEAKKLPLFNKTDWSPAQKVAFVKMFYHVRGHFYRFLWYVGSLTSDPRLKEIVLENIADEFGGDRLSHELLYYKFGSSLGVDVLEEVKSGKNNRGFIRRFNQDHIDDLLAHDEIYRLAMMAAYEALDNADYENLYRLAVSMGVTGDGLVFFEAHRAIGHFSPFELLLEEAWEKSPETVKEAFKRIGEHQLKVWRELADKILHID